MLGRWAPTLALLKSITLLGISLTSNLCNKYIYGWNTINSILSSRTYINTCIILMPTILLSLLSSTLIRTFQSLCIIISCCVHLTFTQLAGNTFAGLNMCSAISFAVAHVISVGCEMLCVVFNRAW